MASHEPHRPNVGGTSTVLLISDSTQHPAEIEKIATDSVVLPALHVRMYTFLERTVRGTCGADFSLMHSDDS